MIRGFVFISLVTFGVIRTIVDASDRPQKLTSVQVEAYERYLKKTFDLHDKSSRQFTSAGSRSANAAAKYLHRLYLKGTHGSQLYDGVTVRSSMAEEPKSQDTGPLRFRIHPLQSGDTLIRAEVYFHRRSHRSVAGSPYYARAHCESCTSQGIYLTSAPSTESASWINFNATQIVLQAISQNDKWLDVEFFRRSTLIPSAKSRRIHAPFLLIFTKSNDVSESTQQEGEEVEFRRKRSIDSYYHYTPVDEQVRSLPTDNSNGRVDSIDEHIEDFRRFGPRILQERQPKKPRRPRYDPNDPMLGFGTETNDEPKSTQSTGRFRTARDDLTVYLLGGENRRTDEQEQNPSNHAQLQSIAHQLGLQAELPPACCAPQRLDSATLLFYDENGDVMLKNYPRMIVTSCGCI
ncbi:Bone morphogenetic protein 3B [Aphelenchoides besseyi]|nr:Bone morphogenetic protein 3B [Aphelenchoides besseyi]